MSKVKGVKGLTSFMAWLPLLLWIVLALLVVGIGFLYPTRSADVLGRLGYVLVESFEQSSQFLALVLNGDAGDAGGASATSQHGAHK